MLGNSGITLLFDKFFGLIQFARHKRHKNKLRHMRIYIVKEGFGPSVNCLDD